MVADIACPAGALLIIIAVQLITQMPGHYLQ
jgi:hypothetical protein